MKSFFVVLSGFGLISCFFIISYAISTDIVLSIVMSVILTVLEIAIVFKRVFSEREDDFTLDRYDDVDESSDHFRLNGN